MTARNTDTADVVGTSAWALIDGADNPAAAFSSARYVAAGIGLSPRQPATDYPFVGIVIGIVGATLTVVGVIASLASGAIWPALLLLFGLVVLIVSSSICRRAERSRLNDRGKAAAIWRGIDWTPTTSETRAAMMVKGASGKRLTYRRTH